MVALKIEYAEKNYYGMRRPLDTCEPYIQRLRKRQTPFTVCVCTYVTKNITNSKRIHCNNVILLG